MYMDDGNFRKRNVVELSLVKYEIFYQVVESGSLTKAGEELNLSQSAISHALASLESEWGFSILNRGRSGITLTSNGKHILSFIKEILKLNNEMMQEINEINGLEIGTVRIGTFSSVSVQWLPEILHHFSDCYPEIDIELLEGDYDEIENWILHGDVDFGFVSLPTKRRFETIPLKKDRMLCIISDNHPLANKGMVGFADIEKEPLIRAKKGSDNDLTRMLKENNVTPNVKFELEDDQAIFSMVKHGMGMSILPELALFRLPENIVILDLEQEYYRTIGIAATSFQTLAPATKRFIEYLKQWSSGVANMLSSVEES